MLSLVDSWKVCLLLFLSLIDLFINSRSVGPVLFGSLLCLRKALATYMVACFSFVLWLLVVVNAIHVHSVWDGRADKDSLPHTKQLLLFSLISPKYFNLSVTILVAYHFGTMPSLRGGWKL